MATTWTAQEDEQLIAAWAATPDIDYIGQNVMPTRVRQSVRRRLERLEARGVLQFFTKGSKPWSGAEDDMLIAARHNKVPYSNLPLPGRSMAARQARVGLLVMEGRIPKPNRITRYQALENSDNFSYRDMARTGSEALLRRMLETGQHNIVCPTIFSETADRAFNRTPATHAAAAIAA